MDLICGYSYGNTLTILTNDGSGGFVTDSSPVAGYYPTSVCAADVNGDGKVDLISANNDVHTLTVLTNASVTTVLTNFSFAASFMGNGANLTNLSASTLTGVIPLAQLSGITGNQLSAAAWQQATNLNGGNAALATNVVSGIAITNAFHHQLGFCWQRAAA